MPMVPVDTLLLNLGTARDQEQYAVAGYLLLAQDATDANCYVDIALNEPQSPKIRFYKLTQIRTADRFTKLFITHPAQSGKTLTLLIGGPGVDARIS